MKCLRFLAVLPLLIALCGRASATPASGLITVDEFGVGTIQGPGGTHSLVSHIGQDTGPGGLNNVLIYDLPFHTVPGDVLLTDGGVFLDVLRFNPDATLVFYSDNLDGFDAPADTPGPPTAFYQKFISIPEVGTEDNNGAFYTPGPGDPGFHEERIPVVYHFISDGNNVAPEPCSLSLLGLGGLPFLRRLRRKQTAE
jgi:hypothetical protein